MIALKNNKRGLKENIPKKIICTQRELKEELTNGITLIWMELVLVV